MLFSLKSMTYDLARVVQLDESEKHHLINNKK